MVFIVITLIKIAVIAFVLLTVLAYLQWVERKVIAHVQVRMGPSRVGPHGLLQPLADVIKLITKEVVLPLSALLLSPRSLPRRIHGADIDFGHCNFPSARRLLSGPTQPGCS